MYYKTTRFVTINLIEVVISIVCLVRKPYTFNIYFSNAKIRQITTTIFILFTRCYLFHNVGLFLFHQQTLFICNSVCWINCLVIYKPCSTQLKEFILTRTRKDTFCLDTIFFIRPVFVLSMPHIPQL